MTPKMTALPPKAIAAGTKGTQQLYSINNIRQKMYKVRNAAPTAKLK
uniref:Uncharacterized protein n=1 Tax=Desmonostoc muscorum LEGE 12446 TaxID=1828758 RepID=A0A8J7D261_DESMC